jgi:hypothetical protein
MPTSINQIKNKKKEKKPRSPALTRLGSRPHATAEGGPALCAAITGGVLIFLISLLE